MLVRDKLKKILRIGFIIVMVVAAVYFMFVRAWILSMGATAEELKQGMPGDELVKEPGMSYTQAITINASKEKVWAYLVQVGYKRGGWYNWDFINGTFIKDYFYENNKSADRIIPELQGLKQGDKIYLAPPIGMEVTELEPYKHMLLTGKEGEKYIVAWSYTLKELDKDRTRLCVRWSSAINDGFAARLVDLFITEPGGAGIQQSQMLRGIKQRAEADISILGVGTGSC
jgi:hypothetical protein